MTEFAQTPAFAPFEWLLSFRYLKARRREGFISVIAGFSFLGIMLGVATLIIVMAVMNGFRKELLGKMLGINGHMLVQAFDSPLTDWKDVADRISQVNDVSLVAPIVDGMALLSSPSNAAGIMVRGIRGQDLTNLASIAGNIKQGTLEGFDDGRGLVIGRGLSDQLSAHAGDSARLVTARGAVTPIGDDATDQGLQGCGGLRDGNVGIRLEYRFHAAVGGAALLRSVRQCHRNRSLCDRPGPHWRAPRVRHRISPSCQSAAPARLRRRG
jgi:hypothetical protein